jgi:hypothetical protein
MRGVKTFVFKKNQRDFNLLREKQKKGPVYSLVPLPLEKGSKFVEIGYDLEKVFDRRSYPKAKKRHQRIVYPFKWLDGKKIEMSALTERDMGEVGKLHDRWVERKLEDDKVYKIMFPNRRYIRCCEKLFDGLDERTLLPVPKLNLADYKGFVFRDAQGEICVVRVVSIQKDGAYDLAFFGNTWDAPSQLMNYCDIYVLKELFDMGIRIFNCGAALNKHLRMFKSHYPHFKIESYMYSRIK